jgi:hypothetical protein
MKNKHRFFKIALVVSLSVVVLIAGTEYGPFFVAVFFVLIGILGWSFFLRKEK